MRQNEYLITKSNCLIASPSTKKSENGFPFTQKSFKCFQSMDLGYDDVSPMIHMTASQILYSAKAKAVSEISNKSLKSGTY